MGIKELIQKVMNREQEQEPELGDDETRDKFLRSLRRQRRVQLEEVEKEKLKKQISDFQKERERKYLWGFKDNKKKQLIDTLNKRKKIKVLKEKNFMIKATKLKKRARNKQQGTTWINKTDI